MTNNISKKTTTHSRHNSYKFLDLAKIDNVDFTKEWCPRTDSNRGPIDYKSIALPAELQGHFSIFYNKMIINSISKLYLIF